MSIYPTYGDCSLLAAAIYPTKTNSPLELNYGIDTDNIKETKSDIIDATSI